MNTIYDMQKSDVSKINIRSYQYIANLIFLFILIILGNINSPFQIASASGKEVEIRVQLGNFHGVNSLAVSPDNQFVISENAVDHYLILWDIASGRLIRKFKGHSDSITSVAFSNDGKYIVSASNDNTLKLWEASTGLEIKTFQGHFSGVESMSFSSDDRFLLSGGQDRTLRLWEVSTGKQIKIFSGHSNDVNSVAVSPNGRLALSGSRDTTIKLWDIETGKLIKTIRGYSGPVYKVAFAPDNKFALSIGTLYKKKRNYRPGENSSYSNVMKIWDLKTGQEVKTFEGIPGKLRKADISRDGRYILYEASESLLKLYDLVNWQESKTFVGPSGRVSAVAFSLDNRFALTGSEDHTVKLWNLSSGQEIRTFAGHSGRINSVAFSSDGKQALSGSSDGTLKLWDINTGGEIKTFRGDSKSYCCVAFSPDSNFIVSDGGYNTLRLWDVKTGQEIKILTGHTDRINNITFSPDGRFILSSSKRDRNLRLWNVSTGKEVRAFRGHGRYASVVFSHDGRYAMSGTMHDVKLWQISNGRLVRTFRGGSGRIGYASLGFSLDNRFVLAGGWDGSLKAWDLSTGDEIKSLKVESNRVDSTVISADGRFALLSKEGKTLKLYDISKNQEISLDHLGRIESLVLSPDARLALSSKPNELTLWDVPNKQKVKSIKGDAVATYSIAFSPDGRYLLSGSSDKQLSLWDVSTGRKIRTFEGHTDAVYTVTFSPDGKYALSESRDQTIKLWFVEKGIEIITFNGRDNFQDIVFSPDGRFALSGGYGHAMLWDLSNGRKIRTFKNNSRLSNTNVEVVAFSPDGRYALSGSIDTIKLFEVSTGKEIRIFKHRNGVKTAKFSPDGRYILSGGSGYRGNKALKLWDVSNGNEVKNFTGHQKYVNSLDFSPDGRFALSGSDDHTVKLWDISTGHEIRTFKGHESKITSVAFSPDGRLAVSSSYDRTIRIWDVKTGEEMVKMISSYEGEWVTLTSDGYYISSPKGDSLIHYASPTGFDTFPAEKFKARFNKPEIIKARLAGDLSVGKPDDVKDSTPGHISIRLESVYQLCSDSVKKCQQTSVQGYSNALSVDDVKANDTSQWSLALGGAQNDGMTSFTIPLKIKDYKFSPPTISYINSSPLIDKWSNLYFVSSGYLNSLDKNGVMRWRVKVGSGSSYPAIGIDNSIYTFRIQKNQKREFDRSLLAVNTKGEQLWELSIPDKISHSMINIDSHGNIYFGTFNGRLYAVSPKGKILWVYRSSHAEKSHLLGWIKPAISHDEKTLYVYDGGKQGCLLAISRQGVLKWKTCIGSRFSIDGSPAVAPNGNVYVLSGKSIYAINPSGNIVWRYRTNGNIQISGLSFYPDSTVIVGNNCGKIYAINSKGKVRWSINLGSSTYQSAPIVDSTGKVVIGAKNKIAVLNHSGQLIWQLYLEDWRVSSPFAMDRDGSIYFGIDKGNCNDGCYIYVISNSQKVKPYVSIENPSNLIAKAISSTTIELSWENILDEKYAFRIEKSDNSTNFHQIAVVPGSKTKYQDTTVSPKSSYCYRIRIYNSNFGNSDYSQSVCVQTPAFELKKLILKDIEQFLSTSPDSILNNKIRYLSKKIQTVNPWWDSVEAAFQASQIRSKMIISVLILGLMAEDRRAQRHAYNGLRMLTKRDFGIPQKRDRNNQYYLRIKQWYQWWEENKSRIQIKEYTQMNSKELENEINWLLNELLVNNKIYSNIREIDRLIRDEISEHYKDRYFSRVCLVKIGKPSIPTLLNYLKDDCICWSCIFTLRDIMQSELTPYTALLLNEKLNDSDPCTALSASIILALDDQSNAISTLVEFLLKSNQPTMRLVTATVIEHTQIPLENKQIIQALIVALKDKDIDVVRSAINSLEKTNANEVVTHLVNLIQLSSDTSVRRTAFRAIGTLGSYSDIQFLIDIIDNKKLDYDSMRYPAFNALRGLTNKKCSLKARARSRQKIEEAMHKCVEWWGNQVKN